MSQASRSPDVRELLRRLLWRLAIRALTLGAVIALTWWWLRAPTPPPTVPVAPALDPGQRALDRFHRGELLAKWDTARPVLWDLMRTDTEFVRLCEALLDDERGRFIASFDEDAKRFFELAARGNAADRENLKRVCDVQDLLRPFEEGATPTTEVFTTLERVIAALRVDRDSSALRLNELKTLTNASLKRGKRSATTLRKRKGIGAYAPHP